jgi:hypothetical protein
MGYVRNQVIKWREPMTVENMIVEAGPLSQAILSITGTDEGTMIVTTRDNRMTLYAAGKRVVFEVPVAAPPAPHRERVYRAVLAYNSLWLQTGFVRMSLTDTETDTIVVLVADITVDEDFSPGYVKAVVEDLDIKASIWREIIENGADDGMNPDASAGAHLVKV